MGNDLIVKANKIVEAGYNLTTSEQRLILSAIAKIPKGEEVRADKMYIVTIDDFKAFGVHEKTAYRDFKEACNKIFERSINIREGKENIFRTRWVQQVVIGDTDWLRRTGSVLDTDIEIEDNYMLVGIMFSNPIIPYLTNLSKEFTQYLKSDLVGVTSNYSIRFYEFICQYRSIGKREISIKDLRYMLNLGDKYPAVADLKRRIIDVAINEINEKTPIYVQYKLKKTGRKYTHLLLTFRGKSKEIDAITKTINKDTETLDSMSELTDKEKKIIIQQTEEYIAKQGIIDEKHKANIINKAMKERWGVSNHYDEEQAEKEKHQQRLEQERQEALERQKEEQKQKEQAKKELLECEKNFLSMNKTMQNVILDSIENGLEGSFRKTFAKERKTNNKIYADVMYSAKFKELMKNIG